MSHITPMGVSEYLPIEAQKLDFQKSKLQEIFSRSGYLPIKTPTIEYSDSIEVGLGPVLRKQCIEFFDPSGKRLMLRPDHTTPIARTVAARMQEHELPIKLSYIDPVFRKPDQQYATDTEIFQAGCELIGYQCVEEIFNLLEVCIESLNSLGIKDLGIDIGHVDFIDELTAVQKQALLEGDYLTYGGIPQRGKLEVAGSNDDLKRLYSLIQSKNLDGIAFINKGLVKGLYYYTGIIFEIYSKRLGKVIASGGQYDNLCNKFGYDCPAVGFAINLNDIHGDLNG